MDRDVKSGVNDLFEINFQKKEDGSDDPDGLDVLVSFRETEKENSRVINSGYGIKIHLPRESGADEKYFKAEPWPTQERWDLRQKENLSEIYKYETDIYYVKELDSELPFCLPFIKEDDICFEVELPMVNAYQKRYFEFWAYVKYSNTWNFVEAIPQENKTVVFHVNELESVCVLSCLKKTLHAVFPDGGEFISSTDDSIVVTFPSNSVTNKEEIQFKVHPVDVEIRKQENDSSQFSSQIFGISPRISVNHRESLVFEKEIEIQLPIQFQPDTNLNEDEMECKILRWIDNTFTTTDIEPEIRQNEIAVFKVQSFSGYSAIVLKKESLQRSMSSLSSLVEEGMGLKLWCKILFFVVENSQRNIIILLECVEKKKVEHIIKTREQYGFRFVREWISRDFLFSPEHKLQIDIKGKFSLPKRAPSKFYHMTFFPAAEDNFTRFVVELNQRVGGDIYGILSLRDGHALLDEIYYDPLSTKKVPPCQQIRKRLTDTVQTSPRFNCLTTLSPRVDLKEENVNIATRNLEKEFLTEKGIIKVTNLLSPDKLAEAFIFMDKTKAQYDHIVEKNPPGAMRNLALVKYALEHNNTKSKLDLLLTALTDVGEKTLADKIQYLYKNGSDLIHIHD